MNDVLIQTDTDELEHKLEGNVPDDEVCYWTVSGKPQRTTAGRDVLFTDGDRVIGRAEIVDVEDGRLWFEPVTPVDEELPTAPTTRGFKYVDTAEVEQ